MHTLLPREREVIVRGGPGWEFWTPGDEKGGAWGSGQNWPLDPAEGGPLPDDPYLKQMWKTFWGGDLQALSPSNRRAVVPGAWRMEVSPAVPARDDVFLHVLEIGDRADAAAPRRVARSRATESRARRSRAPAWCCSPTRPAAVGGGGHAAGDRDDGDARERASSRAPSYEAQLTSGFAPGSPVWRATAETTDDGTLRVAWDVRQEARLRLRRLR